MNVAQQGALERIVGRPLTSGEIAQINPLLSDRRDIEIAAILSAERRKVASREIGIGTILMALAPFGGQFLDGLAALGETDRNVYWSMELLKAGSFDIGLPGTRQQLTALRESNPELADSLNTLMALAEVPDAIDSRFVSDELNVAEGRITL